MSKSELHELKTLIRVQRKGARRGPFRLELRERLNRYLQEQVALGVSLQKLGRDLGLSPHTVSYWRRKWGMSKSTEGAMVLLRPVVVSESVPSAGLCMCGPAGTRLEGLTTDDVAEIWRKLS